MIITVDGPAAAGKGTLARGLARHYKLNFLDTGTLYRRVALAMLKQSIVETNTQEAARLALGLEHQPWSDEELRTETVARLASIVAAMPDVRTALLGYQRGFAAKPPGAVLDGRDTGTVVCPAADAKIFVTASPEVRARRRFAELSAAGMATTFESVLVDVRSRDERDRMRVVAPLIPARDAVILDTSELTIDQALAAAIQAVDSRL
jgi:cytidylate kinase